MESSLSRPCKEEEEEEESFSLSLSSSIFSPLEDQRRTNQRRLKKIEEELHLVYQQKLKEKLTQLEHNQANVSFSFSFSLFLGHLSLSLSLLGIVVSHWRDSSFTSRGRRETIQRQIETLSRATRRRRRTARTSLQVSVLLSLLFFRFLFV